MTERLMKIILSDLGARRGDRFPEQAARFLFVRGPCRNADYERALSTLIAEGWLRKTGPREEWIEVLK